MAVAVRQLSLTKQPGSPPTSAVTDASGSGGRRLSPNQAAKRDEIIGAAVKVLLRDGVAGCTVRSIAAQAGIAKGAVHYYFDDIDELVDQAMLAATRGWIAWLAENAGTPTTRNGARAGFWRAVTASVEPFAHGDRTLMPLWLEYWAACTRAARHQPLHTLHAMLVSYMADLLQLSGVNEAQRRARAVSSYLFGAGMQEPIDPIPPSEIRRDVAALSGLPAPTHHVVGHTPKKMGQSPKTARAGGNGR